MLHRSPITKAFPEYTGEMNYDAAGGYICKQFESKNKSDIKGDGRIVKFDMVVTAQVRQGDLLCIYILIKKQNPTLSSWPNQLNG